MFSVAQKLDSSPLNVKRCCNICTASFVALGNWEKVRGAASVCVCVSALIVIRGYQQALFNEVVMAVV